ncbi:hypothetical protein ACWEQL_15230 [Kitasatospora sp. NPDC004240]
MTLSVITAYLGALRRLPDAQRLGDGEGLRPPSKGRLLGSWDTTPCGPSPNTVPDAGPLDGQGSRQLVDANVMPAMSLKSPTAPTRPWQRIDVPLVRHHGSVAGQIDQEDDDVALLQEHRTEARPDHGLIEVYDADAYLTDSAAVRRSRETIVAGTGTQLYLHSPQGIAPAELTLLVWDGPAREDTAWEEEGHSRQILDLPTGMVVIRAFSPEIAGCYELPRPGAYAARVAWKGRRAAADQEASFLKQLATPEGELNPDPVFAAHRRALESYRIDLWWTAESDPEEDDEDQ